MIHIEKVEEINKELRKFNGAFAQIWLFNVTHKRLVVKLYFRDSDNVLFIISASSNHIISNFSWINAKLSLTKCVGDDSYDNLYILKDDNSDFQLNSSGGIFLIKGLEAEFVSTFENF